MIPPEVERVSLAMNKAGGIRIVLPEDLPSHLTLLAHPTNPERLFQAEHWTELLAPPAPCLCPHCGGRLQA
jgi:hypothetical protein